MDMINVGVTPAGSEWIVRPRDGETPEQMQARAETQRARLAKLWEKHNKTQVESPTKTLPELQDAYRAARSRMYKRAAQVRKNRAAAILKGKVGELPNVWTDPEYQAIRQRVANLNKAIKKASKAH